MIVEHLRVFQTEHVANTAIENVNLGGTRKHTHESFSECLGKVNNGEKDDSLSSFAIQNKTLRLEPNYVVESTSQNHQTIDDYQVKQCLLILEKLMNHKFGWIFNQPVDPVKLMIPDYFSIISKPMDLGSIKKKLETMEYNFVTEFIDDVRLTFANAMQYNPSSNDVHIIANKLNNIFNLGCKSLEAMSEKQKIHTLRRKTNKKFRHIRTIVQPKSSNCPVSLAGKPLTNLGSRNAKKACRQKIPHSMFKESERVLDSSNRCSVGLSNNVNNEKPRTLAGVEFDHLIAYSDEMARLDVQIKDSAEAELKLQREKAREASRLISQNMEKIVDIHENYGFLKNVQSLHSGYSELHPVTFEEEMVNFNDGVEIQGTSSNPLEQYWLFMKDSDMDVNIPGIVS